MAWLECCGAIGFKYDMHVLKALLKACQQ
jgi:hypothetical protein